MKIENKFNIFERKVLRRIIGPIQENGQWRKRYNNELYEIYGEPAVMNIIKAGRLRWAGHIMRMGSADIPKRIITDNLGGHGG